MHATTRVRLAILGAVFVPLGLAAALVVVRDDVVIANIVLVLVIAVVGFGATGRRAAAVLAAVSAAVGFNLFHTQPHLSLRISSGDDVETAVLLLIVGLVVGEIALRGRRARYLVTQEQADLASIRGLGALVAEGERPDYLVLATASELTHLLALVDCRNETGPHPGRPLATVGRNGSTAWGPTSWETERWALPSDGVAIPVLTQGHEVGRFVLTAPAGLPDRREQLAKAVAMVDQAGAALAIRSGAA